MWPASAQKWFAKGNRRSALRSDFRSIGLQLRGGDGGRATSLRGGPKLKFGAFVGDGEGDRLIKVGGRGYGLELHRRPEHGEVGVEERLTCRHRLVQIMIRDDAEGGSPLTHQIDGKGAGVDPLTRVEPLELVEGVVGAA